MSISIEAESETKKLERGSSRVGRRPALLATHLPLEQAQQNGRGAAICGVSATLDRRVFAAQHKCLRATKWPECSAFLNDVTPTDVPIARVRRSIQPT
jgi:hypothetical protein